MASTSHKVVVVTGTNSGVGYETVKALLQSDTPYHIFAGSRDIEKGRLALDNIREDVPSAKSTVELLGVDLNSDESIEKAFEKVSASHDHIDTLVNNAGATFDMQFVDGKVSLRECFTKAYDVNVAGTQVMTWTFMPLLLKSSDPRLIFVAGLSSMTTVANGPYFPTPPQPAGWPKKIAFETIGYRCSKTALNMLMLDWNHKLKADGVKVFSVGPGMLATNLGGLGPERLKELGMLDHLGHASLGGDIIRRVVEGERDADVGKIVHRNGLGSW